jgi:3-hydroxyisobutyrate dehydrogenase
MASVVSRGKAAKLLEGDFSAQAAISDVLKNAALVEDAAVEAGIPHPLMAVCRVLFADAASDRPEDDMIAVIAAIARHH